MAGFADELSVKVSAQDAGVKAAVTTIRGEIRGLEKELTKANAEWMKTGQGSEQIKRTEARIRELREELNKLTGTQKKVQAGADKTGKAFASMGAKVNKALGALNNPLVMAGAGIALAAFAKKVTAAASDVVESMNKTRVIFGDASEAVIAFSDTAADRFGQSKSEALSAAANFAALGKAAGLSGGELSDYAIRLSGLASDMASFNNTSPQEAIVALSAAMRGEYEPMRRYNVLIDSLKLSQRAYDMGLTKTLQKTLPQNIKVMAAYEEVLAQTKDQQGDFARTQDDYANLTRRVAAEWANLQATIGESFLPVAKTALQLLKQFFDFFKGVPKEVKTLSISLLALGAALVFVIPKVLALKASMVQAGVASGSLRQGLLNVAKTAVGPWGLALTAVTLAIGDYMKQQMDAAAITDALTEAMQRQAEQGGAAVAETIAQTFQAWSSGQGTFYEQIDALGLTMEQFVTAVTSGGQPLEDLQHQLYAAEQRGGKFKGMAQGLQWILRDVSKGHTDAARATADAKRAMDDAAPSADELAGSYDRAAAAADAMKNAEIRLAKGLERADRILARRDAMRAYRKAQEEFIKKPTLEAGDEMTKAAIAVAKTYKDPERQAKFINEAWREMKTTVQGSNLPTAVKNKITSPLKEAKDEAKELLATLANINLVNVDPLLRNKIGTLPTAIGDTAAPVGTGPAGSALAMHAALTSGRQTVTSATRSFALGSSMSDHLRGRAIDLTGANLPSYAKTVKDLGGYAAFHGTGASRHLHAVPVTRRSVDTASPASGPVIGQLVVNNPAQGIDIEGAVMQAIRRAERIKRERG